jgi:hypothetical protein
MFGDVWIGAGWWRQREANIGIDPHQIAVGLRVLCDDTLAQFGDGSDLAYPADELAIRFHYRLVLVHPFPNGNGRHSRLAADLLAAELGAEPFTWAGAELTTASDLRADYLAARRRADLSHDFTALIEFAGRASWRSPTLPGPDSLSAVDVAKRQWRCVGTRMSPSTHNGGGLAGNHPLSFARYVVVPARNAPAGTKASRNLGKIWRTAHMRVPPELAVFVARRVSPWRAQRPVTGEPFIPGPSTL